MQKEKRKQSKDEENDSSSRKRRKADLTSMTEPESSRSRPKGAYDVFLSFRGEDNRKNFTDHLYTALVQAGILTFQDHNEIPRGEEISKHLLKAIQESKIYIVVFSKGYASSRWCLNELVEILECKSRKTGQIVLPVFYDIDPSDVRKQTGSFAKAFDSHEESFKEKVKEWRKALEEAGNLSGWNLNDMENGHESKFIQVIVKDVLNKLDPKNLNVATRLVGIDRLVHTISDFLGAATDEVRIVGIHGMPGIGKTTLAKVVFNQLCYGFEGSCFLSNINDTSEQSNGLVLLQEHILHDILKQNAGTINNVDRGMVLIKERLCHKRVLLQELYVNLGSEDINVKQCGIQVIVDLDSFEGIEWNHGVDNQESEVQRDRVIHVPLYHRYHLLSHPPYHLLPHPPYGSIGFTTMEQWKDYLFNFPFRLETLT